MSGDRSNGVDVLHAGQVPLSLGSRHSRALALKTYLNTLTMCTCLVYHMDWKMQPFTDVRARANRRQSPCTACALASRKPTA